MRHLIPVCSSESGAPVACDEKNPQVGNQRAKLQSERDAILTRHLDIRNQEVEHPSVSSADLEGRSAIRFGDDHNPILG